MARAQRVALRCTHLVTRAVEFLLRGRLGLTRFGRPVVVSEIGFGAGLREISRCGRLVGSVDWKVILGVKTAGTATVGLAKTHVMKL